MDPNQNQNIPDQNQMPPAPEGNIPPTQPPMSPPPPPVSPTVPPTAPPTSPAAPTEADSRFNGKLIIFIGVGVFLLIILGIVYFMAQQLNSSQQESGVPTPTQIPTPTLTPTPTPLSEQDIDIIDLGDPETDLKNIEEDVKQL